MKKTTTSLRRVLLARARENRKNPTRGESRLWERLRNKKLDGLKWRRQHVLSPYIVDFYCHSALLALEVDGSSHDGQEVRDDQRDRDLQRLHDVEVVRVTEDEARAASDALMEFVAEVAWTRIAELEGEGG